jgi:multidrug efflux pump subunit AcrB
VPDVDRAVRLAVGGVVAGRYRDATADEAWDVRVVVPRAEAETRLPGGERPTLEVLDAVHLAGAGGPVPLSQVATVVLEPSPTTVRHHGRTRAATVTAFVEKGYLTSRVTADVLATIATWELPGGVRVVAAGEVESREQSFGGLGTAVLVAIFGVLAVLVLEFRTFRGTIVVASVLPLGVVGGLVALFLSGDSLSFTATIGFVALMGIEVKNSILLVDFTNQLREKGVALDDAIEQAGSVRFVPILLTTMTAIGGLIPLVLEKSALTSPLALVLLGGLVSSTLLARVVTPVVYKLLAPAAVEAPEPAVVPEAAAA